jgi:hypothetical protein
MTLNKKRVSLQTFPAHTRARLGEPERGTRRPACATLLAVAQIHGRFLRCVNFLTQNCAVWRKTMQTSIHRIASEKPAAQHHEKLRKNSLGN